MYITVMQYIYIHYIYIPKYIVLFVMYNYGPVRKCDTSILITARCHICFQVRPRDTEVIAKRPDRRLCTSS
jgi:hypothetical protein